MLLLFDEAVSLLRGVSSLLAKTSVRIRSGFLCGWMSIRSSD